MKALPASPKDKRRAVSPAGRPSGPGFGRQEGAAEGKGRRRGFSRSLTVRLKPPFPPVREGNGGSLPLPDAHCSLVWAPGGGPGRGARGGEGAFQTVFEAAGDRPWTQEARCVCTAQRAASASPLAQRGVRDARGRARCTGLSHGETVCRPSDPPSGLPSLCAGAPRLSLASLSPDARLPRPGQPRLRRTPAVVVYRTNCAAGPSRSAASRP